MISSTLRAGDTWLFYQNPVGDYKPSAGYVLTYYLANASGVISIICTTHATEDKWQAAATAAATALYTAGLYSYTAVATKAAESVTIDSGEVKILTGLTAAVDNRTHVKKMLDAIEALLEGRAVADVESYSIAGRQLTKMKFTELVTLRDKYKAEYIGEQQAAKVARGERLSGNIRVKFV